jgi:putative ABC transport system substrate-binding protein
MGMVVEIAGKQMELLKETVPKASRVAVLYNPAGPTSSRVLKEFEVAARKLGLKTESFEVKDPNALPKIFDAMVTSRAQALMVVNSALITAQQRQIAGLAAKARIPAMYQFSEYVEAGGLMAYGASRRDMYHRAATYVDKILKGAKPADLPVEQPTRFELVINLKTAKALGLTIPQSVLIRADHVIQ